ncbi:ABC transporter substrate-binding protein [Gracilibacillus lacisalsi]|uniref:ABC transporter substrate-binding protein n=1 Tax=Gracilibacillus lacisalsi TaxID=393087 RepID=UPI00035EB050|nr:extracellular solute-binding protein [Gracilibacillus lacisalsi]
MLKKYALSLLFFVLFICLAACSEDDESSGSGDNGSGGSGGSGENVELTMWVFPGMGIDEQIERYQEENENVTINIQEAEYADHHQNLLTALGAGSGAPDVAVVESAYIEQFKVNPDQFHNLNDYGAEDIKDDFLEWRWREASSPDGSFVLGIPTDVGPMAMAYRMDIFEEAGLPTDPDEVSSQLSTWEDYIEAGRQIQDATGGYMFNHIAEIYGVIRDQGEEQYFDEENNLIIEESEQIAKAWELAVEAIDIQPGIERESTEYGAALARGDFATVFLPPWMLQRIKDDAPDTEGLWNVAQIPEASGNWGGSLLTIPAQSDHPQEAYDFISWLMAPEQQLEIFKSYGNFPSTPELYDHEEVQNYNDPFFTRDDLGVMFGEAAERVEYVYRSPDTSTVNTIIDDALTSIHDGSASPEEAWNNALEEIDRQISR